MADVSRRHALKLLVWTVPVVVSLDTTAAYADRHSTPPGHNYHPPLVYNASSSPMGPALPTGLTGTLPFTGDEQEYEVGVAAVALCAGFALIAHGHTERNLNG